MYLITILYLCFPNRLVVTKNIMCNVYFKYVTKMPKILSYIWMLGIIRCTHMRYLARQEKIYLRTQHELHGTLVLCSAWVQLCA